MTRRHAGRRPGFTLIEMHIIMMALTVCMLLGTVMILAAMKTSQSSLFTVSRLSVRKELARQFRTDVATSDSRPEKAGIFTAGPNCLILGKPGDSRVIYRWQDNALERIEQIGTKESKHGVSVGLHRTHVEFVPACDAKNLVTMRLTEPEGRGPGKISELSACLGGDLR